MSNHDELEGVQRRRQSLYRATLGLEAAISSPTGDLAVWRHRVLIASSELHEGIIAHVAESEQPGQFLDSVTAHAPHLISAAKKLTAEHQDLLLAARDLVDRADRLDPTGDPSAAEQLRDKSLHLMGSLIRHRQRGTDLVYLAYGQDLGASG